MIKYITEQTIIVLKFNFRKNRLSDQRFNTKDKRLSEILENKRELYWKNCRDNFG